MPKFSKVPFTASENLNRDQCNPAKGEIRWYPVVKGGVTLSWHKKATLARASARKIQGAKVGNTGFFKKGVTPSASVFSGSKKVKKNSTKSKVKKLSLKRSSTKK